MISTIELRWKTIIIFMATLAAWLIGFIDMPLRFNMEPLQATIWMPVSIAALGAILAFLLFSRNQGLSFLPVFFSIQPAAYIIMYITWLFIPYGQSYADMNHKLIVDTVFFILETLLFVPLLLFLDKKENPFTTRLPDDNPLFMELFPGSRADARIKSLRRKVMIFLYILMNSVVIYLCWLSSTSQQIRPEAYLKILVPALVWSVFLGFKEEFIFRWLYLKIGKKLFGSDIIATLFQALAWGLYHAFFGEATGRSFQGFFTTFIGALWFSLLVFEFGSIWLAFISHFFIEILGLIIMYGTFLK